MTRSSACCVTQNRLPALSKTLYLTQSLTHTERRPGRKVVLVWKSRRHPCTPTQHAFFGRRKQPVRSTENAPGTRKPAAPPALWSLVFPSRHREAVSSASWPPLEKFPTQTTPVRSEMCPHRSILFAVLSDPDSNCSCLHEASSGQSLGCAP